MPGEYVPFHLGNFGRDFDPSKAIVAKVNCKKLSPKLKTTLNIKKKIKKRSSDLDTCNCCRLGGISTVCGDATSDDEEVVVDFDLDKENSIAFLNGLEPCVKIQ